MTLLAGTLYDPAVAVSHSTAAALAITAFDTANLRLPCPVPASGRIMVRQQCVLHGATTIPQTLFALLEGGTVKGRVAPKTFYSGALASSMWTVEALFVVSGLTPGFHTFDAAYGVETGVAATGFKYGGPNDAVANNAFGGFVFEIWSA